MRFALERSIGRFFSTKKKAAGSLNLEHYSLLSQQKLDHQPNRQLPMPGKRNILITSALPYVNNKPHLGNLIGAVLSADVYARYARLRGFNVLFVCGTDEYGTASEVKALQQKTTAKEICDKYHETHKNIYGWFDISFDFFGRTSRAIHSQITQQIFKEVYEAGLVVEKESEQLYCSTCDLFLADRFVEGVCRKCNSKTRGDQCECCSTIFNDLSKELDKLECKICKSTPSVRKTSHFYLKLKEQVEKLKKWLFQGETMKQWSNNARGVTKGWFNNEIPDRCITRDLKWGVPVPVAGFQKKVFYVWFEAPLGYISMTADFLGEGYKKWWLKQQGYNVQLRQFMGKDNVLFHSIMFPWTLLGTKKKWNLPSQLSVTEYLLYEGGKFSKSHNMGVFGDECLQTGIPSQMWRYYLLRIRPQVFDSEFSWADFAQKCNKQLLNSIGNLIQRVLKFSYTKYGSKIHSLAQKDIGEEERQLLSHLSQKIGRLQVFMENGQLFQGLNTVLEMSFDINEYVGKTQFWKNSKQEMILGFLMRVIKVYSMLFSPFIPSLTAKVNYLFGCSQSINKEGPQIFDNIHTSLFTCLVEAKVLKQPLPLIRAITEEQVKVLKQKFGSYKSQSTEKQ